MSRIMFSIPFFAMAMLMYHASYLQHVFNSIEHVRRPGYLHGRWPGRLGMVGGSQSAHYHLGLENFWRRDEHRGALCFTLLPHEAVAC
jgi:hypothetical protein